MLSKRLRHIRRKERTRYKLKPSNLDRLRLCFYTSNKYIYSQVIDENKRITITSLATYNEDFKNFKNKNNIKAAELLGEKFCRVELVQGACARLDVLALLGALDKALHGFKQGKRILGLELEVVGNLL